MNDKQTIRHVQEFFSRSCPGKTLPAKSIIKFSLALKAGKTLMINTHTGKVMVSP